MKLARLFVTLDPAQTRDLLVEVASRLDGGFSVADAERFCDDLAAVGAGEDGLVEPIVRFEGTEQPLVISVFKDTTSSLPAVFIASDQVITMIHDRIRETLGEMSVERIAANASSEAQ